MRTDLSTCCLDVDPTASEATTSTLRRAIQATTRGPIPRVDAIRELAGRTATAATADLLTSVAEDGGEEPSVRFEAALSLGRLGRRVDERTLESLGRLVGATDPTVAIGAARALRNVGDERSLRTLMRLELRSDRSPALVRELGAAATLISHRLGSDRRTFRLPAGVRLIRPDRGEGEPIDHRRMSPARLAEALAPSSGEPLAVGPLSDRAASELTCQGRDLLIVPSEHLDGTTVDELLARPTIPAIVYTGANLSLETYQPTGYLLTKPGRRQTLEVAALNGRGRIWLAGTARPTSDRGFDVELSGVATKNAAPVRVTGRFDLDRAEIDFDEATSGERLDRTRRPPGKPTRATS